MGHKLINELNEFRAQFKKKAQDAIKSEFKQFFEAHPEVASVVWTQYTPYFNDGDECVFRMGEIEFKPNAELCASDIVSAVVGEYENLEKYGHGEVCLRRAFRTVGEEGVFKKLNNGKYGYDKSAVRPLSELEQKLQADADSLASLCHGLDDQMKAIFGDHVKVVATRDGFDVSEYDHD